MCKKLVIIPAYNEANCLLDIVEELHRVAADFDYIIVNDGSNDDTEQICRQHRLNVLNLPVNLGIGAAVQTGYIYAYKNNYDIAVQMDGDGQHDPRYLQDIIAPILEERADFVIGSRFMNKHGFQSSKLRRMGISFLSFLVLLLTRKKITDVTSGYRAANRKVINIFARLYSMDYPEPESIVLLLKQGLGISEVSVNMRERMDGKSSINALKSLYYMFKVSIGMILANRARHAILEEEIV